MLPKCDSPNVPRIMHEGKSEKPEACSAPCSKDRGGDDSCFYAGNLGILPYLLC